MLHSVHYISSGSGIRVSWESKDPYLMIFINGLNNKDVLLVPVSESFSPDTELSLSGQCCTATENLVWSDFVHPFFRLAI